MGEYASASLLQKGILGVISLQIADYHHLAWFMLYIFPPSTILLVAMQNKTLVVGR